jgi:hypothetical protein
VRAVRGKIFVSGGAVFGACRAVSDGPERRVRRRSAGKSAALTSRVLVLTLTAIGFGDRTTWQARGLRRTDAVARHQARARPTERAVASNASARERAGRRESERSSGGVRERHETIFGAYSTLPIDANKFAPLISPSARGSGDRSGAN